MRDINSASSAAVTSSSDVVALVPSGGHPVEAGTPVDPVAVPVRALLALFRDALATVRFPGFRTEASDAAPAELNGDALTALAGRVEQNQATVSELELRLAEAHRALEHSQDQLLAHAQRAHAYARIFAEDDAALSARLEQIVLGARRPRLHAVPPAADAPVRRGRKPKRPSDDTSLFQGGRPAEKAATSPGADGPSADAPAGGHDTEPPHAAEGSVELTAPY